MGAWTQSIVNALVLLDFDERAARQAIARAAAAGWLAAERNGRRVRWQLTPAGREYLAAARQRLFAPGPESDRDGGWLVLLLTVPENQRKLRYRLRTSLEWAGSGRPGQACGSARTSRTTGPAPVILTKTFAGAGLACKIKLVMTPSDATILYTQPAGSAADGVVMAAALSVIAPELPVSPIKSEIDKLATPFAARYGEHSLLRPGRPPAGAETCQ